MEARISEMSLEREISIGWVVHRLGDVCIGKLGMRIVEDIVKPGTRDNRLVLVCSAMKMGDNAAEDTVDMINQLETAIEASITHHSEEYLALVEAIGEAHLRMAGELICSVERLEFLKEDIADECNLVTRLIGAAQILGHMSPRAKDIVLGVRERLSCILMAALLQDQGIDSEYINPEGTIDNSYTGQNVLGHSLCDFVTAKLTSQIQECQKKVSIVTGYFGNVQDVSIGRDYADLSAAMLAVGLGADEIQVWKEVDGIFTADPTTVSTALLIPRITPDEAAELSHYGLEIIHPFAMELVAQANIPISLKNIHNPLVDGTVIFDENVVDFEGRYQKNLPKGPTAVTVKTGTVVISIHSNRRSLSCGFFASIFSTLSKYHLTVDLISTSETHVSVALHSVFVEGDLREAVKELKKCGNVGLVRNLAIVSLVGRQMKHLVGIASCMFSTLAKENLNVEMISQGASEINISCVIKEKDVARAMSVLHTRLFLHQTAFRS